MTYISGTPKEYHLLFKDHVVGEVVKYIDSLHRIIDKKHEQLEKENDRLIGIINKDSKTSSKPSSIDNIYKRK